MGSVLPAPTSRFAAVSADAAAQGGRAVPLGAAADAWYGAAKQRTGRIEKASPVRWTGVGRGDD